MKKIISLILVFSFLITSLPAIAITGNDYVIPIIGPATEKVKNFIDEKVELATIKLPPRKIFKIELLEAERTFTPYFVKDHLAIWSSPLRTKYKDLPWLLPASGILTALFLTDNDLSGALTNNHRPSKLERDISNAFGQIGSYGPTLGVPGGLIGIGFLTKNDHLRETGVLQLKAIAHATLLFVAVSAIAGRNKPNNNKKGRGEFFEGGTSFPSGHTLNSFASASVLSYEFPDRPWVGALAYTLASLVGGSRLTQGIHFPSDIFVSALTGVLIGRYIVKHNSKFNGQKAENKKKGQVSHRGRDLTP